MPTGDANKPFHAGPWLVQPDLNRLSDGDRVIALEPRSMDLLTCLASQPGKTISADELLETVWHGRAHVDNTIYQAVSHLRKVLGDDVHHPRYIETIAKKGYRLICPVVPAATDDDLQASSRIGFARRYVALSAGIALVTVAIILTFNPNLQIRLLPTRDIPSDRSVAVLPFVDLSEDGSQQFLSDGITEELIHVLSNLPDMRVTARTSSFAFRDKNEDVRQIGRKLNVATILEGSIRRDADRIRITAQLVDTRDGYHLWSKTFDQDASDLFSIQSKIAAAVATAFDYPQQDVLLTDDRRTQSNELQAAELYLLGMYHLHKETPSGRVLAAQYFERAIESDPGFSRAYSGLAEIYSIQALLGNTDHEALKKAESAAEYALQLDDQSAPAYYALGLINLLKRNFPDAESAFTKAIELNPNDARAHSRLVDTYDNQGEGSAESFLVMKKALQLNPMSGELITKMGDVQYAISGWDWGTALSYYQLAMENDPDYPYSYFTVSYYYSTTGQFDRAFPYAKKFFDLLDDPIKGGRYLTTLYRDIGDYDSAMNMIRQMQDDEPENIRVTILEILLQLARRDFSPARRLVHNTLSTHVGDDHITELMAIYEMIIGDTKHAEEIFTHLAALPESPNVFGAVNLYRWNTLLFGTLGAVNLAYLHQSNGDSLAAEELLRKAREMIESKNNAWFDPGIAYVAVQIAAVEGNNEAAINLFRDAVDVGWSKAWYARIDPLMADLREDARFVQILEELEEKLLKMRERTQVLASNEP